MSTTADLVDIARAELYGCEPHLPVDKKWALTIEAILTHLGIEPGGAILSADGVTELATNLGGIIAASSRANYGDVKQLAAASISLLADGIVTEVDQCEVTE